ALHLALVGAGIVAGDEVIVPAFTFVATAMAGLHQGAGPGFVDVEPRTLGMDPALLRAAITPPAPAVVPGPPPGGPRALGPPADIAARRRLLLIEDAAQAPGARYRDRPVGTLGLAGCFSLQSSKSVACGEGGLLITDDEALFRRAHAARMFGEDSRPEEEA